MNVCPPDCRWKGQLHVHRFDPALVKKHYLEALRLRREREAAKKMTDLPPLTWDEQVKLAALVHAAVKLPDLGVTPIRVWLLKATCDDHGEIQAEVDSPMGQTPAATFVACALCKVRNKYSGSIRADRIVLLRG